MSLATRIKLGKWWKSTLIYILIKFAVLLLKKLGRFLLRTARTFGKFINHIPIVWKTAVIVLSVCFIEILCIAVTYYETDILIALWVLQKTLFVPVIIFVAIILKKLQNAGEALAGGNLTHRVDTKYMFLDFKRHAECLNSISDGINAAVEERMKSERMKTELITNVSHDLKTPLTSIISYADLISKEPSDNAKITEYSEVLLRQSERLKRLIDDLMEVSKASTGNIDIFLESLDISVLLSQTAAEYEQRFVNCGLEPVIVKPDCPVKVLADGRRMWRVLDNLLSNICKYSQAGTRVWFTLEKSDKNAVLSLKNISKAPLNLSPDELTERFTRGDASRSNDGNGLGLSIAKSLTELQGGTLEITTDGDLFKAVIKLPVCQ